MQELQEEVEVVNMEKIIDPNVEESSNRLLAKYNFSELDKDIVREASKNEVNKINNILSKMIGVKRDIAQIADEKNDNDLLILSKVVDQNFRSLIRRFNLLHPEMVILQYGTTSSVYRDMGNFQHYGINKFDYGRIAMRTIEGLYEQLEIVSEMAYEAMKFIQMANKPEKIVVGDKEIDIPEAGDEDAKS